MIVYRIAKSEERALDLSGTGAFKAGGRWNNEGSFALYTSEHQALAFLELLVHLEEADLPPDLYIVSLAVDNYKKLLEIKDEDLPPDWRLPGNLALKHKGDLLLKAKTHIGFRVRSAVLPEEYNVVLNPQYPEFNTFVKILKVERLVVDQRLK
jgi:RES domain-containing protein